MTVPEYIHVPGFPDTAAARARLDRTFDRTFGLGLGLTPGLFDPETEMIHVLQERPFPERVMLSATFTGTSADMDKLHQYARNRNTDIVEVDVKNRVAHFARLTPEARAIRKRLAAAFRVEPHTLEVAVEVEGTKVLLVQILRTPDGLGGTDAEKRVQFFRSALPMLPGGHVDWRVEEDAVSGRIVMEYREQMVLPRRVDLLDILPTEVNAENWATPAFGVDAFGRRSSINLRRAPHLLVVGATGAGKTVNINAQVAARLLAGHDLIIIETEKKFADFRSLIPFLRADTRWTPGEDDAVRYRKAVAIFEYLRIEADRRARLFVEYDVQAMWELPLDVRERENVRAVTIVLDEADGAFEPLAVPNLTDKQDSRIVEAAEINEQKALLNYHLAYFAKTFRSVGFSLIVGLQRADVAALGGSDAKLGGRLRNNLPGGVFLAVPGQEPDAEGLRMVFKTAATDAAEARRRFDTGDQGLALTSVDEVPGITAVRVGYAPVKEIVVALRERGVAEVEQWDIDPNAFTSSQDDLEIPESFGSDFAALFSGAEEAPLYDDDAPATVGAEFVAEPVDMFEN